MDHTIVCFDECAFRLVPVYRKIWFLKGKKPNGLFFWSNKKLNVFGAYIEGKKLFYEFHIAQNSLTYLAFLSSFVETLDEKRKYVFILDNAGWHKTEVIRKFLAKQKNIKVEYLPPYSPELNPIETCWKTTRARITNSNCFKTLDSLQEKLENFWNRHFFTQKISNYLCP